MTQTIDQDKLFLDGTYTVESPEQVEIDFELAGPGSRFCALLIDVILMAIIFFMVAFLSVALAESGRFSADQLSAIDDEAFASMSLAIIIIAYFLLNFGYFLCLEWLLSGRSLGKIAMQLRAVRDDGTPIAGTDILLRNLLRVVDAFPVGYVVGGVIAFFHPLHKRLGDLAAGTIVIKERPLDYAARPDKGMRLRMQTFDVSNPHLTSSEKQLLQNYFRRRSEFAVALQPIVAQNVANRLAEHHGGDTADADLYLSRLATGGDIGT